MKVYKIILGLNKSQIDLFKIHALKIVANKRSNERKKAMQTALDFIEHKDLSKVAEIHNIKESTVIHRIDMSTFNLYFRSFMFNGANIYKFGKNSHFPRRLN